MTQEKLTSQGFIVFNNEIKGTTYKHYLLDYGQELTTTPNGVSDKFHIRKKDVEYEDFNEKTGEYKLSIKTVWQIWDWGYNGNHPRYCRTSFDNEEDAELYYYELLEKYIAEKNWDAPQWNNTYKEAISEFANFAEKPEELIARYFKLKEIKKRKHDEERAKDASEYAIRKEWLSINVPEEAESIIIDEKFKDDLKEAGKLSGYEKSNKSASALKGLLERNGKNKINTDFWQVFRILKKKLS